MTTFDEVDKLALERQAEREPEKWISVKERLPDTARDVLCFVKDMYDYGQDGYKVLGWTTDHWRTVYASERAWNDHITHWQEITPPKDEDK